MHETINIDVDQLIGEYEQELGRRLARWVDRMEAVVSGAIDYDDIEPVVMACADIADEAQRQYEEDHAEYEREALGEYKPSPYWSDLVPSYIRALLKECRPNCEAAEKLMECGRIADEYSPDVPERSVQIVFHEIRRRYGRRLHAWFDSHEVNLRLLSNDLKQLAKELGRFENQIDLPRIRDALKLAADLRISVHELAHDLCTPLSFTKDT